MIEIAPGVYRIPTMLRAAINSYLFVEDDGSLTLVDAGLKGGRGSCSMRSGISARPRRTCNASC